MKSINIQTKNYIYEHLHDNIHNLVLKKSNDSAIDFEFAFRQIDALQRIRYKIPTFYNTENLIFPKHLNIEQSSSESTALYKKSLCEGSLFIDLNGGFGVDSFFISGNFTKSIYIERDSELCEIVEHNFNVLGCNNIEIINKDLYEFIPEIPISDCIYIDPARRNKTGGKTVFLKDCEPDVTEIFEKLLEKTKTLIIKLSPMLDISAAIKSLMFVQEVHIVSVVNDCKEVILILRKENCAKIKYIAANINNKGKVDKYQFDRETESALIPETTNKLEVYLYEPNSAILKGGAFKSITKDFGVKKLHLHTHLYTSTDVVSNFPGRIFEIGNTYQFGKKGINELKLKYTKANISTRNFPLSPEELKKKTGIIDGGDNYLFGCTLADESKVIIACQKLL